jgi:hypothetical protein
LAATELTFNGAPLIIKNSWNCFRISSIRNLLPKAKFIWLKRDISKAAASDLEARYITKGDPREWNSATPSNVEELKLLTPEHQVIENQFEFNSAIASSLSTIPKNRWISLWYEDLLQNFDAELKKISFFLNRNIGINSLNNIKKSLHIKTNKEINNPEAVVIKKYIYEHINRLKFCCYLKKNI